MDPDRMFFYSQVGAEAREYDFAAENEIVKRCQCGEAIHPDCESAHHPDATPYSEQAARYWRNLP